MGENSLTEWNRGKEMLEAAKRNALENDLKTAANRIYFAAERATVSCLMQSKQRLPKHHRVIWVMSRFLALNIDTYGLLRRLYDLRLQADYGKSSRIIDLTPENMKVQLQEVDKLFKVMRNKYHFP